MSDLVQELASGNENSGSCPRDPMSWLKVSLPAVEDGAEVNENKKLLLTTSSSNQAENNQSSEVFRENAGTDADTDAGAGTGADGHSVYPWTLRFIEKRGYCAFANRSFMPGDLIMTEAPTVTVTGHHPFTPIQKREIDDNIEELSVEDRNAFFDMTNVFPESGSAAGIFMTNSFDMVDSPGGMACGMYVALARLNHSCVPNAQQTHVPSSGCEVLYASRKIEIGDEICDCYIDLRQNRESRRKELFESFRFLCECPACVRPCSSSSSSSSSSRSDGQIIEEGADGEDEDCKSGAERESESSEDDADRVFASCFEDEGIDLIVGGQRSDALKVLLHGLSVLQKPCNIAWSIRYQAGAHLMVHQVLLHELQQASSNDGGYGDRRGNTGTSRGCRSALEKRSRSDKLKAENGAAEREEVEIALMRKHLQQAHLLNLQLEGPMCPETVNTELLVRKYCFGNNFRINMSTD